MVIDKNTKKLDIVGRLNTKILTNENFIIILITVIYEFKITKIKTTFESPVIILSESLRYCDST